MLRCFAPPQSSTTASVLHNMNSLRNKWAMNSILPKHFPSCGVLMSVAESAPTEQGCNNTGIETERYTSWPVNLNPQISYNNMDAVLVCCDWDPDPPNILESNKVTFFCSKLHNNINIISKLDAVWLCRGKVHSSLGQEGWPSQRFFCRNTLM